MGERYRCNCQRIAGLHIDARCGRERLADVGNQARASKIDENGDRETPGRPGPHLCVRFDRFATAIRVFAHLIVGLILAAIVLAQRTFGDGIRRNGKALNLVPRESGRVRFEMRDDAGLSGAQHEVERVLQARFQARVLCWGAIVRPTSGVFR